MIIFEFCCCLCVMLESDFDDSRFIWVFYRDWEEWKDVIFVFQDDGFVFVVQIVYFDDCKYFRIRLKYDIQVVVWLVMFVLVCVYYGCICKVCFLVVGQVLRKIVKKVFYKFLL